MAAIEAQPRSATVRALERTVVAKLSKRDLMEVGNDNPLLFFHMAQMLSQRLRERNDKNAERRQRPRVFIISSSESKPVVAAVEEHLRKIADVVPWTRDVFALSQYTLESLEEQLKHTDFAVAIAGSDDLTTSRGIEYPVPRDNVILEYGMFMGKLGRHRAILLERGGVKPPTDLHGLTVARFEHGVDEAHELSIATVCATIEAHILKHHV